MIAFLEKDELPLKPPTVYLDWYLKGEITRLIVNKKIDLNKREVFLYSSNYITFCKNFIFYNIGSKEEIEDNPLYFLLGPLEETLQKLKVNSFFLIPSKNLYSKINDLMEFFKKYHWDYYD